VIVTTRARAARRRHGVRVTRNHGHRHGRRRKDRRRRSRAPAELGPALPVTRKLMSPIPAASAPAAAALSLARASVTVTVTAVYPGQRVPSETVAGSGSEYDPAVAPATLSDGLP
jgi:hypothetical protein